ncbi:semaphorin-1A-like isoform X2 [Hetaerina americana]|uniref:semaphorin-1A-like isoform X2 n=1 Tax=Hetaerina americana TaxID=62018 RepID=UPI003A7F4C61
MYHPFGSPMPIAAEEGAIAAVAQQSPKDKLTTSEESWDSVVTIARSTSAAYGVFGFKGGAKRLASSLTLYVVLFLVLMQCLPTSAWVEDVRTKMYVQLGEERVQRFLGNQSHKDHFKLLEKDQKSLLVGARNIVYNISLYDLTEFTDQHGASQRIEWHSTGAHRELCYLKGKSEDDCQNYIRVLAKIDNERVLICGTNAYKPLCRHYRFKNGEYEVEKAYEGRGLCPYDPDHNSTGVYSEGELYTATVADFSGTDPLLYREPLRTERSDLKQLNAPNFVSSMSYKDFVFFFFRETAVEYINCGKTVYSRVARVCKHDKGGPHQFGDRWTSFLKSRLNCSVPGDYPFYFNEIQSTSEIIEGNYGDRKAKLIYGVFTTPINSISGSAVCAFTMEDILDSFEGPFKEQETMNSNWLAVPVTKVPEPRPGQCVNDSRTLPDVTVNFVKSHGLMDEAVPAFFGLPVVIRISMQYRFTMIAVDPQVRTSDGKAYDVLFIGTDDGKVIKAINSASYETTKKVNPVIIEEIQVFPINIAIKNLYVVRMSDKIEDSKLIVVSDDEIQAIKLHRCSSDKVTSCRECIALQDPYCAWDPQQQLCLAVGSPEWSVGNRFIQNVAVGEHPMCAEAQVPAAVQVETASPSDAPPVTCLPCVCPRCIEPTEVNSTKMAAVVGDPVQSLDPIVNEFDQDIDNNEILIELAETNIIPNTLAEINQAGPKLHASQERLSTYTTETLAIAVATACVAALVVGFVSGFLFSRRCRAEEYSSSPNYHDMPFPDQRHQLNRLTHDGGLNDAAYLPPSNNKAINLVLNVPPKNANGKNANSSAENKPIQKVKKTYI